MENFSQLLVAAAAAGVASHHVIFRRFDAVDQHPFMVLSSVAIGQVVVLIALWPQEAGLGDVFLAYKASIALTATFIVSLWASIIVYRTFFHPLNHIPGPFAARTTKLWAVVKTFQSGIRWYIVQTQLHEKYGDYVRTGPREVVIFDPEAISIINAPSSKFTKGPWYDMMEPSLQTFRDRTSHNQRRRIWDRAFSVKSLNEYRPAVDSFTTTLLSQLAKQLDKEIIINDLVNAYSYDVMSGMVFGNSLDMLKNGEKNAWILRNIQGSFEALGYLQAIPWIFGIFMTFPGLLKPLVDLTRWSREQIDQRKQMKDPKPDLFKYLLDIDDGSKQSQEWLMADARLAIGAGSDTTSTALTIILLYLARYPEELKKLQEAVDKMFSSQEEGSGYDCTKGANCPHLEGVINEVLRLHPGVPGGLQRVVPPGGVTIGGTFLPGGTLVVMSTYSLCRDERNFEKATEFIPERWYAKPEMIKNKAAFLPFSSGPYSCVGKSLAMMEMRSVISRVVREYDVKPVPGFDPEEYITHIRDHFTAAAPPLKLVFSKRS